MRDAENEYFAKKCTYCIPRAGLDSSVGIETVYRLDDPGIAHRFRGEILSVRPDRPWGHPLPYTIGTGPLRAAKRSWRSVDNTPPFSAKFKEKVQLYLYSPIWAFKACYRAKFTF